MSGRLSVQWLIRIGDIFLGVREKPVGAFKVIGVVKADKMIADLWNTLNSGKVSANYLDDQDIKPITLGDKTVIRIHVPRANRQQKPVYLNNNPMQGTYRRFNEGDHLCDPENVRRMLAEQVEESRDTRLLDGFTLADLDMESLQDYRQMFQNHKPTHPYNKHDHQEFLRCIGGWRKNRKTGEEGLTLAGLLMFGQLPAIQEGVSNYLLDYQERPEAKAELRWIDRITLDGTWSGNLFDFYRRVINKLTADLKVPFQLDGGQRKDHTPVHEALREALVNTLVHADYSGRMSVLVVKRPDMFGFRNPGLMRIPIEQAIQGGDSDCRNRTIHQMFLMIGLGERAGSGIPKIYSSWSSQHWRQPRLHERVEPEQTLLELRMIDLLPQETISQLLERFGNRFTRLGSLERVILATAGIESVVNHARLQEISTEHPSDISRALQQLVKERLLETSGSGRGMVYCLPGAHLPTPDIPFPQEVPTELVSASGYMGIDYKSSDDLSLSSDGSVISSDGLAANSDDTDINSDESHPAMERHQDGRLIITSLGNVDRILLDDLLQLTEIARKKKRLPVDEMEQVIIAACKKCYLSLRVLAELLSRSPDPLRQSHLNRMVRDKKLLRAFPLEPNSPKQAYTSAQAT
ncbi:AAA family ATPase [Endozoicomonas gorgoniicola]|uniref:AAA family ATPase n=1 Tax=Endozoicomonas gorgoniicola TaxID=1234144 RepID=A0ABT3N4Y6_9GAMM|nr:ATP-binding protein [Endozoicomonas gorgoniicola]MCW7556393.1 AAA family ATPase [Endozoicomonas gorgoniicola]